VRWFYGGSPPAEVVEWFYSGERTPEEEPQRVDQYLRLGDTDALGIKLREGMLEIKRRHRQQRVVRFHEHATGLVEHWRKWGFSLAEAGSDPAAMPAPRSSWIGVQKGRKLRKYKLAEDGELLAIPTGEYPDRGCTMELTTIHVEGQEWWSLGFEAFGEESSLAETLMLTARYLLAPGRPPSSFDVTHSYGYPKWLQAFEQWVNHSQ
jgi:hypothetical protein